MKPGSSAFRAALGSKTVNSREAKPLRQKRIVQMDSDLNIIEIFDTTTLAGKETGVFADLVRLAADNHNGYAGGYRWRWEE